MILSVVVPNRIQQDLSEKIAFLNLWLIIIFPIGMIMWRYMNPKIDKNNWET